MLKASTKHETSTRHYQVGPPTKYESVSHTYATRVCACVCACVEAQQHALCAQVCVGRAHTDHSS